MTITAAFSVPSSWQVVVPGPDPEAAVARAVEELFVGQDRDSAALNKHWMREGLTRAVTMLRDVDTVVLLFAFPKRPEEGVVLPVSATVVRTAGPLLDAGDDPLKALAVLSAHDSTAQPLPVLNTVALRTHEVREGAAAFAAEVEAAPIAEQDKEQLAREAQSVPMLRVRYTIPAMPGHPWHLVEFSALLGETETGLEGLYLGLFDAFVQGMREVAA
jgi:hypothetical protein